MIKPILAGVLLASLVACGTPMPRLSAVPVAAPVVAQAQSQVRTNSGTIQGAYLSVDIRPSRPLYNTARDIRMSLGYIDMGQAIPARPPDEFHVTVAYFQNLSRNSAEKLAESFRHQALPLKVEGWGVAKQQAAYFTVSGLQDLRKRLHGVVPESFSADDPHVTIGVVPGNPHDVHGVPKPAQTAITPITVTGDVHLRQGDDILW